ncbi:Diacylglycerol O-acyltransferase 2A like protein [Verticillium longisporum]|nr:Diacylglycerol O-acyltransferase 2A like protein [Verticillium longisporum]
MAPHSNETANFGDEAKVATAPPEALESQAESKPEMKSDKKSATQLESIVRPVAERQESSHEYSGTGLDETPKSPTRGHYRTPSLNAARRRGSRQEDGGATNYARASGSVRSDNSDETVHTLSIWNTLTRGGPNNEGMGRGVTIVIGGARESLEAQPGHLRLIIKGRKGFIKMALRTGADLVPVLAFGENDLYDQLSPRTHPMVHRIQMFLLNVFKFTLPALHGRGILNYDVGVMPYRRPLNIVVGKPIRVAAAMTPQPDQADIDRLHALYVAELQKLWETYKDQFAKDRTSEMTFIG